MVRVYHPPPATSAPHHYRHSCRQYTQGCKFRCTPFPSSIKDNMRPRAFARLLTDGDFIIHSRQYTTLSSGQRLAVDIRQLSCTEIWFYSSSSPLLHSRFRFQFRHSWTKVLQNIRLRTHSFFLSSPAKDLGADVTFQRMLCHS